VQVRVTWQEGIRQGYQPVPGYGVYSLKDAKGIRGEECLVVYIDQYRGTPQP